MPITVVCDRCNRKFEIPATEEQLADWRSGTVIQKAMPEVDAFQRELLISGICGDCFDDIFSTNNKEKTNVRRKV